MIARPGSLRVRLNVSKGEQMAKLLIAQLPDGLRKHATREYRFHPVRMWRLDVAIFVPGGLKLGVEIEGGAFVVGAHTRGAHFRSDCEKYAEAAILGWTVLRVMPEHVTKGIALGWIERLIEAEAAR